MCGCVSVIGMQTLKLLISRDGIVNGPQNLVTEEGDVCLSFTKEYLLSQALLIVAVLAVTMINTVLKAILVHVTPLERHASFTGFHHAVTVKLFFALVINTGLTVLLVNAHLSGANVPTGLGIFSGQVVRQWSLSPSRGDMRALLRRL